jgi:hypothetical protein
MGFLPWEKWLPPYVFGPLLCIGSACVLGFARDLHWWNIALLGFGIVYSAWGTWVWISTRRNIFWPHDTKTNEQGETKPR